MGFVLVGVFLLRYPVDDRVWGLRAGDGCDEAGSAGEGRMLRAVSLHGVGVSRDVLRSDAGGSEEYLQVDRKKVRTHRTGGKVRRKNKKELKLEEGIGKGKEGVG